MDLRRCLALVAAATLSGSAWAAGDAPYAGWDSRSLKALSAEQVDDLRSGRGMGLALAAELNGYPGPRHVLDLAGQLGLTTEQRAEAQRLLAEMQAQAIVLGEQVIAGEAALESMFSEGAAAADSVQAAAIELGRLQGMLRAHHLHYHLAMRDLLSAYQVMRYQHLRGYAADGAQGRGDHGIGHAQ